MPAPETTADKPGAIAPQQEMDEADRQRVRRLMVETTDFPGEASTLVWLAAYKAVLLKDIRSNLDELLAYKKAAVHR